MNFRNALAAILGLCIGSVPARGLTNAAGEMVADGWRRERRIVDLHQHLECSPERLGRAVRIMDVCKGACAKTLGIVTREN